MANGISSYSSGYKLSVGRRILVIRAILNYAEQIDDTLVEGRARERLDAEQETWRLHRQWKREKKKTGTRPKAKALDSQIDQALGGAYKIAENYIKNLPPDHPLHQLAREFIDTFYPDGLKEIVHQSYEDQIPNLESCIELWRNNDWAPKLDQLNVTAFVDVIEGLLPEYHIAVTTPAVRELSYDDILAAEARGHDNITLITSLIIGLYGEDKPNSNAIRKAYLETYDDQQRRVGEYHQRNRTAPDIDIDTGDEVEDAAHPITDTPNLPVKV